MFTTENVVHWQAIYEVCSGEENVVTDLKMIKEVRPVQGHETPKAPHQVVEKKRQ